jgi:hypothetical protein
MAAGVASLVAMSLVFATDPYTTVVTQVAGELAPVDRVKGRSGPSLDEYNECIARLVSERAKSPPCPPGDEKCLQRLSPERCVKPTDLQLVTEGDVDSALTAGEQVQGSVRGMLVQRQTLALAQLWQLCRGFALSLGLCLLLAMAASYSALSASRMPLAFAAGGETLERYAKASGLLLAAVAVLALVAALAGGAQIRVPGWDHPRLVSSIFMAKVGVGAALVAAVVAAFGALTIRRALVALEQQDEDWDEAWDRDSQDESDDA